MREGSERGARPGCGDCRCLRGQGREPEAVGGAPASPPSSPRLVPVPSEPPGPPAAPRVGRKSLGQPVSQLAGCTIAGQDRLTREWPGPTTPPLPSRGRARPAPALPTALPEPLPRPAPLQTPTLPLPGQGSSPSPAGGSRSAPWPSLPARPPWRAPWTWTRAARWRSCSAAASKPSVSGAQPEPRGTGTPDPGPRSRARLRPDPLGSAPRVFLGERAPHASERETVSLPRMSR